LTIKSDLDGIFRSLNRVGLGEAEIFRKQGRARRFEIGPEGKAGSSSVESGWAVRAGSSRASMLLAGTGSPRADLRWPDPDGQPLRLPEAIPVPAWSPPADLDKSLVGESEAFALLTDIEGALSREVPGGRLLRGRLEEGTSETSILSTGGVDVEFRSRASALFVEVVGPWQGSGSAVLSLAERDHHHFQPVAIAKRLANRLLLAQEGSAPSRERGDVLIGSAVTARILASLLPLFLGVEAEALARRLTDKTGRLGSDGLTIVDDGRFCGGILESPVDGEGLPTGPLVLIERGRYRQSLADWRQVDRQPQSDIGCVRREGWRELPHVSPSHLFLQPQSGVGVGELLGAVSRGHFLLEPLGSGLFDFQEDRFRIPVCGFVLRQGKASAPLSRTWLEGGISTFLRNIQAVARDLTFHPLGAMIGAPTILVNGLGLRAAE